jgi:hypothetical protein
MLAVKMGRIAAVLQPEPRSQKGVYCYSVDPIDVPVDFGNLPGKGRGGFAERNAMIDLQ